MDAARANGSVTPLHSQRTVSANLPEDIFLQICLWLSVSDILSLRLVRLYSINVVSMCRPFHIDKQSHMSIYYKFKYLAVACPPPKGCPASSSAGISQLVR